MFANRSAAGELLADRFATQRQPIVLGIARGGVIVADAIARILHAPLDVVVIRKVGHPLQPELALGAVSASGQTVVSPYASEFSPAALHPLFAAAIEAAAAMEGSLRNGGTPLDLRGVTALLVDDGIATSSTMACGIAHARNAGANRIVCAAPVAPVESVVQLAEQCDDIAVLIASRDRDFAVGRYYVDFREVDDRQVREALRRPRS